MRRFASSRSSSETMTTTFRRGVVVDGVAPLESRAIPSARQSAATTTDPRPRHRIGRHRSAALARLAKFGKPHWWPVHPRCYGAHTAERRWSGVRFVQYRQWRYRRVEARPRDLRGIAIATRRGLALRAADHLWSGRKRLYQYDVGYRVTRAAPRGGPLISGLRAM